MKLNRQWIAPLSFYTLSIILHGAFFWIISFEKKNSSTPNLDITEIELIASSSMAGDGPKQKSHKNILAPRKMRVSTLHESTTAKVQIKKEPPLFLSTVNDISPSNASSGNSVHIESIKSQYITKLRNRIESHKVYPRMAKKMRQSGKVVILLEILKDGSITHSQIVEECPYTGLNQAAMQLVAKIKTVDPLPHELHLESWQIYIPIAYVLR